MAATREKPLIVLIHGAWHGSWSFDPLQAEIAKRGRNSLAVDLPGYGVHAQIPKSFYAEPFSAEAFATEPSPVRHITLDTQASAVCELIGGIAAAGSGPVILAGHSMGGAVITAVAERMPQNIHRLFYISAFMPESGVPPVAYIRSDANEGERVAGLFVADPQVVGALRINPRSADPAYRAAMIEAYAGTVPEDEHDAMLHLLTPDHPAGVPTSAVVTTAERWGRVPRTYLSCLRDQAIRPALQRTFIARADAFTPGNPTEVVDMDSCHSPFHSDPARLADIIVALE